MKVIYGIYDDPAINFTPPIYDKNSPEEMLLLAQNSYEVRNFKRALYILERLISDYPDNIQAKTYYDLIVYGLYYPEMIILEVTNICKMDCPGCFASKNKGFMKFDQFKSIIDESSKYLRTIRLYNHGDSFYHPDIYEMINYMTNMKHMEVYLSTHGSFDNFDPDALVHSGTRLFIDFSIDGASAESYNSYRTNGDFDLVIDNMRRLVSAKRKYNSKYPIVEWKFIVMKTNEHEMTEALELAEQIGVDKFLFDPFAVGWFKVIRDSPADIKDYMETMAPSDRRYLVNDYASVVDRGFCGYRGHVLHHCWGVGRYKPIICWNGDVSPCSCCKPPYTNIVGNVFDQGTFKAVWDSEKYRKFRRQAVLDCTKLKPCDNCHIIN